MPPSSSASTTTARGAARRRRSLSATGGNQTVGSEIGHQGGRNGDRAVWLLARLQQSGEGAGQRHARRIQRVDELRLVARLRSEEHTSELQSRLHLVCRLLL